MTTSLIRIFGRGTALGLLLTFGIVAPILAGSPDAGVSQTWQMLDYLATDYAGAVQDGEVISQSEYAEMQEFAATSRRRLQDLGAAPALLAQNDALIASIAVKASPEVVSRQAHALADALLAAYPVPTSPEQIPDLARGAVLYQAQCASCHGATGRGDGPAGLQLDPAPVNFVDQTRADQRSALSLYEAITRGVDGTAMAGYADQLSSDDRWALAYYVGSLAYAQEARVGAALWQSDREARGAISSLKELSEARVGKLGVALGEARARSVLGYLRAHPEALKQALAGIPLARERMAASLAAYQAGAIQDATRLALSAYLDGVELMEPQLNARDSALRAQVEIAMGAYRTSLSRGAPMAEVIAQAREIDALLARAQGVIAEGASTATAAFVGAFTILVREGLEALLIVVALLAFLRKAQRHEALPYVHAGWTLALVAGGITWAVANYAVSISGASRELTEGFSSLFAAAVLLSVGLWMHQKSIGGRWQVYLAEKMATALNRRSAWFLFGLAFISVYREVFETILFYVALWSDGQGVWLLGGAASGAIVLGLVAWVLMRTSRRLPLGTFFSASSALIAVLAVVLTGKGVSALQEAGWIAVTPVSAPHFEWLGIFPTSQTLLAQLGVIVLLVAGYLFNIGRSRRQVGAGLQQP